MCHCSWRHCALPAVCLAANGGYTSSFRDSCVPSTAVHSLHRASESSLTGQHLPNSSALRACAVIICVSPRVQVKEMKSESGAAVDGGAGAAAASTATVSAKPRKAKPAAPSKRAGTTDLDAALQRARGRIVPITANVVSLELVDPFRPDLDPEPSVMLGLSDGKQSTVVRSATCEVQLLPAACSCLFCTGGAGKASGTVLAGRYPGWPTSLCSDERCDWKGKCESTACCSVHKTGGVPRFCGGVYAYLSLFPTAPRSEFLLLIVGYISRGCYVPHCGEPRPMKIRTLRLFHATGAL